MQYIVFILAFIILIIVGETISSRVMQKKLKIRLQESFGQKPCDVDLDIKSFKSYFDFKNKSAELCFIDDITWNDLNMDSVFKRICNCQSKIGKEYLYFLLRNTILDTNKNTNYKAILKQYEDNTSACIGIQIMLNKLNRNSVSIIPLMEESEFNQLPFKKGLYKALTFLSISSIIFIVLSLAISSLIGLAVFLFVIINVVNGFVYYKSKNMLESNILMVSHFIKAMAVLKQTDLEYIKNDDELKKHIDVFNSLKPSLTQQGQGILSELRFLFEYLNIAFLVDVRSYLKSVDTIRKNKESFEYIYEYIGCLDSVASIVSYRQSLPYHCKPKFTDKLSVDFKEIYHPLIDDAVANDCCIKDNIILTGANATGKSTFIKSIAINNILALSINTCCAKEYVLFPTYTITSMALRDDIICGESYYITEVKSLKRIIDKVEQLPCICFIDEILRGTNTVERISASISVLQYIQNKNCICLVATHDSELAKELEMSYKNYHFEEKVTNENIYFDYKLKEGITNSKNAIKLLNYYKYDKEIIQNAEKFVKYFESINKKI